MSKKDELDVRTAFNEAPEISLKKVCINCIKQIDCVTLTHAIRTVLSSGSMESDFWDSIGRMSLSTDNTRRAMIASSSDGNGMRRFLQCIHRM